MLGSPPQTAPRDDLRRLVRDLRPAILDLFEGYAVPADDASTLLQGSLEILLRHADESAAPRKFFLQLLEDRCAAWAAAREAEESPDGSPPDA